MASFRELRDLQPLTDEQLWPATIEAPLQLAIVETEQGPYGELRVLGNEKYTKEPTLNTPFKGPDRYRWLAAAVTGEHRRFESDFRYGEYLDATELALRNARRLNDDQLTSAMQEARQIALDKRAQRYAQHARQLSSFIRERGDIYLGFGLQGAYGLKVAKLEDVAPEPPGARSDGRREPVAIVSGQDGLRGLRPLHLRVRRELFLASQHPQQG